MGNKAFQTYIYFLPQAPYEYAIIYVFFDI